MRDTIITILKKQQYTIYQRLLKLYTGGTAENPSNTIEAFQLVDLYYNAKSQTIDRIVVKPFIGHCVEDEYSKRVYTYILNITYADYQKEIAQIIDFKNPEYKCYSVHNDKFLPYAWQSINEDVLTKQAKKYHIYNLNGQKTTIDKQKGWALLDFWDFYWGNCKQFLDGLKQEKDSLGYRVWEHNGIKIMSINPFTDNVKKIKDDIAPFATNDITYYTKGMITVFSPHKYPAFYLISPAGVVVYQHEGKLENYDEILKIVKNYKN